MALWRRAYFFLLLAAVWLAPLLPAYAANPSNVQITGVLNQACAVSTPCVQAGPVTAGAQLCLNDTPPASVSVQVAGTYVGTLTFEGTLDGQNYLTPSNFPATSSGTGSFSGAVTNVGYFCVRMSSYTSGSVQVTINVNNGGPAGTVTITSPLDVNGYVNVDCVTGCAGGGGGGGNVTIVGPLDGLGFLETSVQNWPATQNVAFASPQHTICDSGCSGTSPAYFPVPANTTCSAAACVVKASAGILVGIINLSTSAQPAGECDIYDNASAGSGQVLYPENGIGAGQVINFAGGLGFKAVNGITIKCAVAPSGNGLLVLYQ